jgi:predicted phage-related endonuclease|tara:strand:- start:42 stop:656 length:615 start_codon:yes stop_codon:yes gene_type:complete
MRVTEFEQRTEGWFQARLGKPSASSFHKLITPTGKPSASAMSYVDELVAEKITGKQANVFVSEAMQRGADMEPEAMKTYKLIRDSDDVYDIGFCLHDTMEAGASPDALVGNHGLLEIKCPMAHTMVGYLRAGNVLPSKYIPQVQGQMWITGEEKEWCDFLCYHPDMKLLLVRVERDQEYIDKLAEQVEMACALIEKSAQEFLAQ